MKKILLPLLLTLSIAGMAATPKGFKIASGGFSNATEVEAAERSVAYTDDGLIVTYKFDTAHIQPNATDPDASTWRIDGFYQMTEAGVPDLPQRTDLFYLEGDAEVKLELIDYDYRDYQMRIGPTNAEQTLDGSDNKVTVTEIADYSGFYPVSPISGLTKQKYRNYNIYNVQVFPTQYDMENEIVRALTSLTFKVSYTGNTAKNVKKVSDGVYNATEEFPFKDIVTPIDRNELEAQDSVNDLTLIDGSMIREPAPGYVILTTPALKESANKLKEWKTLLGYEVQIISESAWTPEKIKSRIASINLALKNLKYIVILGKHKEIPAQKLNGYITDYWYACLDGNDDQFADCAIGRIDMDNTEDVNHFIDRLIKYELTPPTAKTYYSRSIHPAEFNDPDGDGYEDYWFIWNSEQAVKYLEKECGRDPIRLYRYKQFVENSKPTHYSRYAGWGLPLDEPLSDPDFNWNITSTDVFREVNAGAAFVLYRGHGNVDSWARPYLHMDEFINFNNVNLPTVFFNQTCLTGDFSKDCFSNKLINLRNGGALCAVACTGTIGSSGSASFVPGIISAMFPSPGLTPLFKFAPQNMENPIKSGAWRIGDIILKGYLTIDACIGNSSISHRNLIHCLGDPAMKVYVNFPYHNSNPLLQNNSFVTFSSDGLRINSAICPVTVYNTKTKKAEYYSYGTNLYVTDSPNDLIVIENNAQKTPRIWVGKNATLQYLDINQIK